MLLFRLGIHRTNVHDSKLCLHALERKLVCSLLLNLTMLCFSSCQVLCWVCNFLVMLQCTMAPGTQGGHSHSSENFAPLLFLYTTEGSLSASGAHLGTLHKHFCHFTSDSTVVFGTGNSNPCPCYPYPTISKILQNLHAKRSCSGPALTSCCV